MEYIPAKNSLLELSFQVVDQQQQRQCKQQQCNEKCGGMVYDPSHLYFWLYCQDINMHMDVFKDQYGAYSLDSAWRV